MAPSKEWERVGEITAQSQHISPHRHNGLPPCFCSSADVDGRFPLPHSVFALVDGRIATATVSPQDDNVYTPGVLQRLHRESYRMQAKPGKMNFAMVVETGNKHIRHKLDFGSNKMTPGVLPTTFASCSDDEIRGEPTSKRFRSSRLCENVLRTTLSAFGTLRRP